MPLNKFTIDVPGSKSLTNRALMLSALVKGKTTIKNVVFCDDTKRMIDGIKKLGLKIKANRSKKEIIVDNSCTEVSATKQAEKQINIYMGNAGTSTRFLTALCSIKGQSAIITGDNQMQKRPISALTKALNGIGANIETNNGFPPIAIKSQKIEGGVLKIPGNISSQYISALIMIAPFTGGKTIINIEQKLYSKPYTEMTIKMMEKFGIKLMNKNFRQFYVKKRKKSTNRTIEIESDASSASYLGAYAAINPSKKIILKNIHKNSIQGDIKFLEYLKLLGCTISEQKNRTIIQGPEKLKSLGKINMNDTPDLVMTFAVLALFGNKPTKITDIENLRIKETDRIEALKTELSKFNLAKIKTGKNFIEIIPKSKLRHGNKNNHKIIISTYNDHRIAMAFGILKTKFKNLKIENPKCVSKSYPTFWSDLKKLT